jgi:uncharacterized membrane protein (UPF0127 family)
MSFLSRKHNTAVGQLLNSGYLQHAQVTIGNSIISVEVVSSTAEINKGLAHRHKLEASHGMLFIFDHSAIFKFWMRGMCFPLDILWIGEDMHIVDISENVPTVPLFKRAIFYSPRTPARYVLEVNASFCASHGIKIGDAVTFDSLIV